MKKLILLMLVSNLACAMVSRVSPLPRLGTERGQVTVSGISSGAMMAVQLSVAKSSLIKGAGIVAGGVYGCAEGSIARAVEVCMANPGAIEVENYVDKIRALSDDGLIDPAQNIKKQSIFIFHGAKDSVVKPLAGKRLEQMYSSLGAKVKSELQLDAGHTQPTKDFGNACTTEAPPFIGKCEYDGAGEILKTVYGPLNEPSEVKSEQLTAFDQREFGAKEAGMSEEGFIYVPEACKKGGCKLHVALHGCLQSPFFVKDAYRAHAGYNQWAESNGIVILYPSTTISVSNPYACWDWWGYTGPDYARSSGKQVIVLTKMIERLTQGSN